MSPQYLDATHQSAFRTAIEDIDDMDLMQISQALLTPVVAGLGIFIAFQQLRTNKHRLKHELFDRRFAVYLSASDFLRSVISKGKPTEEAQAEYLAGIQGAKFLFNEAVSAQLNETWKTAVELEMHQFIIKDLPVGEERTKEAHAIGEAKIRLPRQFADLDAAVAPFLDLGGAK